MAQNLIMQWTEDGDLIFLSKLKGSNPNREKHPTINCPHCGKFMFYVFNKDSKNDTLCFDIENPRYSHLYRDHIRVCPKCHHRIGIAKLTANLRKRFSEIYTRKQYGLYNAIVKRPCKNF